MIVIDGKKECAMRERYEKGRLGIVWACFSDRDLFFCKPLFF